MKSYSDAAINEITVCKHSMVHIIIPDTQTYAVTWFPMTQLLAFLSGDHV